MRWQCHWVLSLGWGFWVASAFSAQPTVLVFPSPAPTGEITFEEEATPYCVAPIEPKALLRLLKPPQRFPLVESSALLPTANDKTMSAEELELLRATATQTKPSQPLPAKSTAARPDEPLWIRAIETKPKSLALFPARKQVVQANKPASPSNFAQTQVTTELPKGPALPPDKPTEVIAPKKPDAGDLPAPRRLEAPDPKTLVPPCDPALGAVPKPSPEVQREFDKYIEKRVVPENSLELIEGQAAVLVLKVMPRRVYLADPTLITVTTISEKELGLAGQKVGTTVMTLWFTDPADPTKQKILSYLIRICPDPAERDRVLLQARYAQEQATRLAEMTREQNERNLKSLESLINRTFPDSYVHLSRVGDKIVVAGQAKDATEASNILRLVRAHAPDDTKKLKVDNVQVNIQPSTFAREEQDQPGRLDELFAAGGPDVINLLRIPGEQQVMLRVVVAEVNRAAARSIGVNFTVANSAGTQVFANLTGNLLTGTTAGGAGLANLPASLDNGQIRLAINALRTLNLAKSLSEPNLVAVNGQSASFQAGGSFPIPVISGFTAAGLQGVNFQRFGVSLRFTPLITDRDRIRLNLNAMVSSRDPGAAANVAGTNIPGLTEREFNTVVELREGQTLAIAGLIQSTFGSDATRVPFFGDIPLLGRLAGFDRTSANEQELIVLVTPELVHPVEPNHALRLPGQEMFDPSDVEFYLWGRLEGEQAGYRSPARTTAKKMLSKQRSEEYLLFGPQGYSDEPTQWTLPNLGQHAPTGSVPPQVHTTQKLPAKSENNAKLEEKPSRFRLLPVPTLKR